MAVLILNPGGSQIVLPLQKGQQGDPREIGEETAAFAGNLRSSVRLQKMVLPVVSVPVDAATQSAVKTLFANRAQVNCQGDLFNNASASVLCSAKVSSEMLQGGLFWVITLTLSEV